jgi:hypothetical protein
MIMVRKALPRRSPNRITLVELDGSPVRPARRPAAPAWSAEHDNWRWVASPDAPESALATLPSIDPEPETDAEWLARLDTTEAAEVARIESSYRPTTADLAEYDRWLDGLGDGPSPYAVEPGHSFEDFEALRPSCHTIAEWDAIHSGQVTETELAMRAAGMAL